MQLNSSLLSTFPFKKTFSNLAKVNCLGGWLKFVTLRKLSTDVLLSCEVLIVVFVILWQAFLSEWLVDNSTTAASLSPFMSRSMLVHGIQSAVVLLWRLYHSWSGSCV